MSKFQIHISDAVEISLVTGRHDIRPFISTVVAHHNQSSILVNSPDIGGLLPKDEKYFVSFPKNDGVFRFDARISAHKTIGNKHFTEFNLTGGEERIQKRDYFRMPSTLSIRFSTGMENDAVEEFTDDLYAGSILDLSGGGIKLATKYDLSVKNHVKFDLQLGADILPVKGEIVRKTHNKQANMPFMYGVKFIELAEPKRGKIISYLQHRQIKALKVSQILRGK